MQVAQVPRPAKGRKNILGLQIDAGAPDGACLSVLYRPWKFLRLGGGMLYNYVGEGVRGSVSVLPYFPLAPSFTLEAGHYFNADARGKVSEFTHVSDDLKPLLESVGYSFVNAQLGIEIGHPNWFVFFFRVGISRVWLSVNNAQKAVTASAGSSDVTWKSLTDPRIRLGIPSAKVGFIFYVY